MRSDVAQKRKSGDVATQRRSESGEGAGTTAAEVAGGANVAQA